jgi:F0F1-type ATP synthase epsilon subunit
MKLFLVNPIAQKELEVAWIELNTPTGNIIILPEHAPTVVSLNPDQPLTYCLKSGKRETFMVHRGMAEIGRHDATIIVDGAL